MDSFYSELWLGYLAYQAIEKCVSISRENCPGCSGSLNTALLHKHHQDSLLEKIVLYLHEARGLMSSNFDTMFDDFRDRMEGKCSDDERKVLIKTGRTFLFVITPPGLFYGRYLTAEKYTLIFRSSNPTAKPPGQKRKRAVRSSIPPIPSNDDCSKTTENSSKPPQTSTPKKKKLDKPLQDFIGYDSGYESG